MEPDTSAEVVVPLSKGKIVLLLVGAVAFVVGSIWIWSIAGAQTRYNPLYMKAAAIAGVSFFGLCAIYGCLKVFDTRPGLIIDDQGIVDNSSAVATGRVFWDEIVALKVSEIAGQRFITILVAEPQKRRGNFFGRMLNATNTTMTGSPINISSNSLRMKFDELVQVLNEAFEKHKGQAEPHYDFATGCHTTEMTNAPVVKVDDAHLQMERADGREAKVYHIGACSGFILDATDYTFDFPLALRDKPHKSIQVVQDRTHQFEVTWEPETTRYELSVATLQPLPGSQRFEGFRAGDKIVIAIGVVEDTGQFAVVWAGIIQVQ